jgi:sugar phosphate permease
MSEQPRYIRLTIRIHTLCYSYMNMQFARYGKSGTAAGVSNAAASFGVVLQSYGFVNIADRSGWPAVTNLWIMMVAAAVICTAISVPLWSKFKKR